MAYATISDLRAYLHVQEPVDDALLQRLLNAAQSVIDAHCGHRRFEAVEETREYNEDAIDLVDPSRLYLDDDVTGVIEVRAGGEVVTDYKPIPRWPPYHALRRPRGWPMPVLVRARWGYSDIPPPAVVQATVRLVAYFYRQRDAQVFDVTAIPDQGVITVPRGIPADVERILSPYRRLG